MRNCSTLFSLLFIVVLSAAPLRATGAQPPPPKPPALFLAAKAQEVPAVRELSMDDPLITRSRLLRVDLLALDQTNPGQKLLLNLFTDVEITAVVYKRSTQDQSDEWVGRLEGNPFSQVLIVAGGGQISADISLADKLYQVRYAGNGLHTVQQIDPAQFPPEMDPIEISLRRPAGLAAAASDPAEIIDVMVLYTPAASSEQGGKTAIRNLINLAILGTNQSYTNSGVLPKLNLVHTAEVAYTEAGDMGADLERLRNDSDGFMDQIHALRNAYHADLVSLIVRGGGYCGIAYQMTHASSTFAELAFSVISRACATGNFSFAHELGHNMGARHDWYVDNGTSPSTYSHGFVNVGGRWRTIMAYNNECALRGCYCSRLPYWSNPALTYSGSPLGVPSGTDASCGVSDPGHPACDADDHRTLNDTAIVVANFRARGPLPPAPVSDDPPPVYLPTVFN